MYISEWWDGEKTNEINVDTLERYVLNSNNKTPKYSQDLQNFNSYHQNVKFFCYAIPGNLDDLMKLCVWFDSEIICFFWGKIV